MKSAPIKAPDITEAHVISCMTVDCIQDLINKGIFMPAVSYITSAINKPIEDYTILEDRFVDPIQWAAPSFRWSIDVNTGKITNVDKMWPL